VTENPQPHIDELSDKLGKVLNEYPAPIQTAVLADLAAIHLCGYIQPGSRKRTEVLRLKMLDIFVRAIQRRIPYQETRLAAVDNEWARTIQNLE
jgi:hypothetical protein